MEHVHEFQSWLVRNKDKIQALQDEVNRVNDEYRNSFEGAVTLYHGTSPDVADLIRQGGFQLTKGLRTGGFLSAEYEVDNQAIFLSEDKGLARGYGGNRSDFEADVQVLEVRANISNTLDMTQWGKQIPLDLRKFMLQALSNYEGKKISRPTQSDMFWFVDQPEIVEEIKAAGYDSIRFAESTATKKSLGLDKTAGDTIAVFDPSRLSVFKLPAAGIGGIFQYLKDNQ